jgi:hypothetical protein
MIGDYMLQKYWKEFSVVFALGAAWFTLNANSADIGEGKKKLLDHETRIVRLETTQDEIHAIYQVVVKNGKCKTAER